MPSLRVFNRERSPPKAIAEELPPDAAASTEEKLRLYERLSIKSPPPNITHAQQSSTDINALPAQLHRKASLAELFHHLKPRDTSPAIEEEELEFPPAFGHVEAPIIPSPKVFLASRRRFINEEWERGLPSPVQCSVHLMLLEAFWLLKRKVTVEYADAFDVVFGYQGRGARAWREGRGWGNERVKNEVEWVEAEKERVWKSFIELAAVRFEAWWKGVGQIKTRIVRGGMHGNRDFVERWRDGVETAATVEDRQEAAQYSADGNELAHEILPPLDVLLVWYSYLLVPETYCRNSSMSPKSNVWEATFPWTAIHTAIDHETFAYHPDPFAISSFTKLTGEEYDLFTALRRPVGQVQLFPHPTRCVPCPKCNSDITLLITEPVSMSGWIERTEITCTHCCATTPKDAVLESTYFGINLSKAVLAQTPFLDEMHHHLWIRSPALSGIDYWGIGNSLWTPPAGTLDRAIERLRDFIASKGNVTTTALPLDVDLVWRTLVASPAKLGCLHPEMNGKRLIKLAACRPSNVDKKKQMHNAKRYGPSEWERCLCWTCEASRTEREAAEKGFLTFVEERRRRSGPFGRRDLDGWEKNLVRKNVRVVVSWYAECEMARREKRQLPSWEGLMAKLDEVRAEEWR